MSDNVFEESLIPFPEDITIYHRFAKTFDILRLLKKQQNL
jgi:hypothetical protein